MLVDRTHRVWAVTTFALAGIATSLYFWYANAWPGGPAGRTWPGMVFGVAGTLLMIFAGYLSARKKTLRLRMGSLSWWLKGHIWLGLLSVPLIFFHTAMRWGGPLEFVLMIVFLIVIVSGILGLLLQNLLPRLMKTLLPTEAIPDQIEYLCTQLQLEADDETLAACGADVLADVADSAQQSVNQLSTDGNRQLASLYLTVIRPYLGSTSARDSNLNNRRRADLLFDRARSSLAASLQPTIDSLEEKCSARRQLQLQSRIHLLLHGWLRIHIPLSIALLVFTISHIVTALFY